MGDPCDTVFRGYHTKFIGFGVSPGFTTFNLRPVIPSNTSMKAPSPIGCLFSRAS